ncbi:MAG: LysE family transporter [Candidatus Bathyarchaeales archaeon]
MNMEATVDFYTFIFSAILLSLSGVMSPGPLFAVTIAKSLKDKMAGVLISIGHGVVEFPLMFLIYFGLSQLLASNLVQKIIGFFGGLILIFMGVQMLRSREENDNGGSYLKYGSLIAGVLATGSNPYFLVWWATVGADLVMKAAVFGLLGFSVFAVVHWLCDFFWNTFVSVTVFKSQRFWNRKVQTIILGFCIAIFIVFGAWFVISAAL